MKRKMLVSLIGCILVFSLISCVLDVQPLDINVEKSENLYEDIVGTHSFIRLGNRLSYDPATRIVYMVNGHTSANESKTYCPYYVSNGLPYKYNPETNTF